MPVRLKSILVGYNGTGACRTAVKRAGAIAVRAGARVHVLTAAVPPVPVGGFGWSAPYETSYDLQRIVKERTAEGAALLPSGVAVETRAAFGNPGRELVEYARKIDADLIVLGRVEHSALDRFFLGSAADKVVRLATAPCLIAAAPDCATRVLVAVDDSPAGDAALRAALTLTTSTGAELRCVHVVEAPPPGLTPADAADLDAWTEEMSSHFVKHIEEVCTGLGVSNLPATTVRLGAAAPAILAEATEHQVGLIVAGTHGRGFFQRAILGSVSETLLREARGSLMVVPA
jgi:nucleotide-binding universal stress UspA family protein